MASLCKPEAKQNSCLFQYESPGSDSVVEEWVT